MILSTTNDGSSTLLNTVLDEHYHSHHGARQESMHVFIENGLYHSFRPTPITLLEIGFGTGFNALLTAKHGRNHTINYVGIEAFPISNTIAKQFENTLLDDEKSLFESISKAPWNTPIHIHETFKLTKNKQYFQEITLDTPVDLIYFDAFSPRKQPENWSTTLFTTLFHYLNPKGCLVTYCAKGEIKRRLRSIGYQVETLPGPPGKREMIRASKESS